MPDHLPTTPIPAVRGHRDPADKQPTVAREPAHPDDHPDDRPTVERHLDRAADHPTVVRPDEQHSDRPGDRPVEPSTVGRPDGRRFELRGRIGAGNHGVVFRVRDHQLQRDVAIKRFSHFLADDPRAMRRITREVATLARVQHHNVVTVHDLVHMPDGDGEITPHLVMELVEGTSLRDLLVSHGPSPRSVVAVRGVLEGLAACHQAGILHLDIKPANVLVTAEGGVKIVDFGIARAASDATATVAGTPHYMAPEQYEGRADERSDIYSVGCLLYECLTGHPPFAGTMAEQLMAHRHHARPDPSRLAPDVSPALAATVMRAMAVDPAARHPSVGAMLHALAEAGTRPAHPEPARTTGPATRVAPAVAAVPDPAPRTGPRSQSSREMPPARAPESRPEALAPALPMGPVVTRWSRLQATAVGLAATVAIVGTLPALAWASLGLVPPEHVPAAMTGSAGGWWLLAVGIAAALLLLRGRAWTDPLGGPPVGSVRPQQLLSRETSRALRTSAWAAVRGSLPLLFPWYVLALFLTMQAIEAPWPADPLGSGWSVAWVLTPVIALALLWRGVMAVRPRLGSLIMSMLYLTGAAVATGLFVLYPLAVA